MRTIIVGFVGFGRHARRLKDLLIDLYENCEFILYHPSKTNPENTNRIDHLFTCDAVFITSPNDTHFEYIVTFLNQSKALIFCEKPPCTSAAQLKDLRNFPKKHKRRIFFNFNYRYSSLCRNLKSTLATEVLGRVTNICGTISHGLATKNEYPQTWRGRYPKPKSAVLDTSLIHLVDLCNFALGGGLSVTHSSSASFSHGLDSFSIGLESPAGATIFLFGSYATPYHFSFKLLGTNGLLEVSDTSLTIKSPRDTFDESGLFISPPKYKSLKYSFDSDYQDSLKMSLENFVTHLIAKRDFSEKDFDTSLGSTALIFDATATAQE